MGHYRNEEDANYMSVDDFGITFRDPPEVTDGLFSRCDKKKEENKKACGCATKEKKEEKRKACGCKEKSSKSSRMSKHGRSRSRSRSRSRARARKSKRTLNAFIIFYLEMYGKSSGKHVTCVAIEAGKKWCNMSEKEKEKYIQMAKARKDSKKEGKKC